MRIPDIMLSNGLSPHTRGNLSRVFREVGALGSIPAHAGEPVSKTKDLRQSRVYPRTRGGTIGWGYRLTVRWGLSPHTRGNRLGS